MRILPVLTFCLLFSCSNEDYRTFQLSKEEATENSLLDPLGIRFSYPKTFIEENVYHEGERLLYVFLTDTTDNFTNLSIAPMSDSTSHWPVDDFFNEVTQDFNSKNINSRITGITELQTAAQTIQLLHILNSNGEKLEGHTWGVIEHNNIQLQIQISEYVDAEPSVDNFLSVEAKAMLTSLVVE